ncbi:hypothetical protein A2U01_0114586, partial [Trifolium medium]|nr:hypothetical protein [Trifolium medium]
MKHGHRHRQRTRHDDTVSSVSDTDADACPETRLIRGVFVFIDSNC